MARYLLDSNAFIRFENDQKALRKEAREAIEDAGNDLFISVASIWEMSIKAAKGRLPYFAAMMAHGPEALLASLRASNLDLLSVEISHALASTRLPQQHKDPFDRLIIAQAIEEDLVLITSDRTAARYPGLRVLAA